MKQCLAVELKRTKKIDLEDFDIRSIARDKLEHMRCMCLGTQPRMYEERTYMLQTFKGGRVYTRNLQLNLSYTENPGWRYPRLGTHMLYHKL